MNKIHYSISVLCNNPKKYAVVEPEGRISAQKCADIVVRHVAVSPAAVQQTDKFRIHIFDEGSQEVVGRKDVLATLHSGVDLDLKRRNIVDKFRKTTLQCIFRLSGPFRESPIVVHAASVVPTATA